MAGAWWAAPVVAIALVIPAQGSPEAPALAAVSQRGPAGAAPLGAVSQRGSAGAAPLGADTHSGAAGDAEAYTGTASKFAAREGSEPIAPPVLVPLIRDAPPGSGASSPADPAVGAPLDPAAVAEVLAPLLTGGAFGTGRTPARVEDLATGEVLYSAADVATVPASTMKLVTAVAALDALGADAVLQTRTAIVDPTAGTPRVVLIGGGDPSLRSAGSRVGGAGTSLSPASLQELAASTARALRARGIGTVRIGYDGSLFVGPALHPTWPASFPAAGIVAPVSALQIDQGRRTPTSWARVPDPSAAAARVFAEQLEAAGVEVRGKPKEVRERADSIALASVSSPSIGVLVERTLSTSDNDYAEALARLAAEAGGFEASFEGVAAHAAEVMARLGVATEDDSFADGSGLSRANALSPSTLTGLLAVTSTGYGHVGSGLSVAGATGSLRGRYDAAATRVARGVVRAKTGTLTGVVGLAGYVSRPDGRLLAFAFLDDSMPGGTLAGRAAVDRAAAALVSCDCALP